MLAPTSLGPDQIRRAPRVPLAASAAPVQPGAAEVGPGEIGGAQAHWTPPGGRQGSGRRGDAKSQGAAGGSAPLKVIPYSRHIYLTRSGAIRRLRLAE